MIAGHVSPSLEPIVRVHIEDSSGQTQAMDAIIDTGFSGYLSVPPSAVARLGLKWILRADSQLADGTFVSADVYAAIVIWNNKLRSITVQAILTWRALALIAPPRSCWNANSCGNRPTTLAHSLLIPF